MRSPELTPTPMPAGFPIDEVTHPSAVLPTGPGESTGVTESPARWEGDVALLCDEARGREAGAAAVLLYAAGRILEDRLRDPVRALERFEQAASAGPSPFLPALRALRRRALAEGSVLAAVDRLDAEIAAVAAPAARADLLVEKALLLEDRLFASAASRQALDAALKLVPGHATALAALAALAERAADRLLLRSVLEQQLAASTDAGERSRLLVRLGLLAEGETAREVEALTLFGRALDEAPGGDGAPVARAGLLRAATRLGRDAEVLRALSAEAEAAPPGPLRAAYRGTTAAVLRHRMGEAARAGEALEAALLEQPKDLALLAAAVEDAVAGARWARAVELLDREADITVDGAYAAALRGLAARIAEHQLGDDRRAAQRLRVVLLAQPADVGARRALARIAARSGDTAGQLELAEAAVGRADDPAERAALALRAAEIAESGLGDAERAAALARRAVEAVPGYAPAVLLLERLYADLGRWQELAALIERGTGGGPSSGAALRFARLGALYENRLGDPGKAMALYAEWARSGEEGAGAHAALLRAAEKAHDGLVAAEAALALGRGAVTPPERVAWLYRAATLYEERAAADDEAIRAYDEILSVDARFRPALAGLGRALVRRGQLERAAEVLAAEVALPPSGDGATAPVAILALEVARLELERLGRPEPALAAVTRAIEAEPGNVAALDLRVRILARLGKAEEMASALGALADKLSDPAARAAAFRRQAEILEWKLRRPREALVALDRALSGRSGDVAAELAQERLMQQLGRHADVAALQEKSLASATDAGGAARRLELALRVSDPARADALLARVLAERPGDVCALEARLALARRAGRDGECPALAEALAAAADGPAARVALWRLAASARDRTGDGAASDALVAYERLLEAGGPREAGEAYERLARARGDLARVVLARRREVEHAGGGTAGALALWELAMAHAEGGDLRGACADLERALEADPGFLPAVRDLARLRERLREHVLSADLHKREAALVKGTVAGAAALEAAARLFAELGDDVSAAACLEQALALDPEADAAFETLEALLLDQEDVERLARVLRARSVSGSPAARRDRLLRLATLLQERRPDEGLAALADAVAIDGQHVPALERQAELLAELHRPAEAVAAYRRLLAATSDAATMRRAWIRIGEIGDGELGDAAGAVAAYGNALLVAPDDPEALAGLADVTARQRDFAAAAATLRRLALVEPRPSARVEHLLALAQLLAGPARDPAAAADAYLQALELAPTHAAALDGLDGVLTALDEPARLASAIERWLAAFPDPLAEPTSTDGRSSAEIVVRRLRLAALLEGPLGAPQRAAEELRLVTHLQPDDLRARGELARVLGGSAGRPAEAVAEHLELLRRDPLRVDSLRALESLFVKLGDGARAGRAAALLACLRASDAAEDRRVREARTRPPREPVGAIGAAEFESLVRHPDERHPATALLASMVELLPRLYPLRVEDWGVTRADRLGPRSENPLRPLVDRVAQVLGVTDAFEVYVAKARVRDVDIDATEPPALLVAAGLLRSVPRQEALMHLGRQLGRLRARTHGAGRLSPSDLDVLIAAAVRTVFSEYGRGLAPEVTLDELSHRISRAVPRKQRRAFEAAVVAVGESAAFDNDRWRAALEHTGHRAALAVSGDVIGCFDHIVRSDRRLAAAAARSPEDLRVTARASIQIVEMCNFAVGDELAALHARLGL